MLTMPTASQAMIVMAGEGEDPRIPRRRYGNVQTMSVASYNMDTAVRLSQIGRLHQNEKLSDIAHATYEHNLQSRLTELCTDNGTYNPARGIYRWEVSTVFQEKRPHIGNSETNSTDNIKWIPKTERVNMGNMRSLPNLQSRSVGSSDRILEDLGFRKRKLVNGRTVHVAKPRGNSAILPIVAKYVPSPPGTNPQLADECYNSSSDGDNGQSTKQSTLIDELKRSINYDCRIQPARHMRKSLPPENPFAVCLSFRENDCFTHKEVKDLLESRTGFRIRSIQYDPVSIRESNPDIGSRWIVTYSTPEECKVVVSRGLDFNGDKIAIKKLDDVMKSEYNAYKIFQEEEKRQEASENMIVTRRHWGRRGSKK